jgi:glycosyltransferase involved in cell wall biosynthesis
MLKRIAKNERIDIIHAHARIPAFVGGFVAKALGLPMVTTVHGSYATGFVLSRISNWGDRTIAVSEDLKQYLLDHYKVDPKNVTVSVNGIDTTRFAPAPPDAALADSLAVSGTGKKLFYLGRIGEDSGETAFN